MLFEPYLLWPEPRVVAYQRDDPRELELLIAQLPPGSQLLYHCPGHDGRAFFQHLQCIQPTIPHVRLHLMANTLAELRAYRENFTLPAAYGPVSLFINERVFTVLPEQLADTDATYVARFEPLVREHVKRLPLARAVQSLSIVTFCLERRWGFRDAFYRTFPELSHARVNDYLLSAQQVAKELNRARVLLALSREEGCMRAFTEGLLCGTPAVSTACHSARTEFFDDEHVIVCNDDAQSVAAAVAQMVARAPARDRVREQALRRVSQMRAAYVEYLSQLTAAPPSSLHEHLFGHPDGPDRLSFSLHGPSSMAAGVRRKRRLAGLGGR